MDDLVQFGILVESLTFPHLPMAEAIDKILATPSINLTAILPREIGIPDQVIQNPRFVLNLLKSVLPTLPHDSNKLIVFTLTPIMTSLVLATTAGRFLARISLVGMFRSDDWWALASAVVSLAMMVMWIIPALPTSRINGALGKHVWDISYDQFTYFMMLHNTSILLFAVGNFVVKIQFLVFYYSLSPLKIYRRLLLAAGSIILAIAAATVCSLLFQCTPFNYWDHLFTAKCIDRYKLLGAVGWATLGSDIILLLIPISLVLNLDKMKLRVKLQVIAIFGAGILVCVACVGRVIRVGKLINEVDATYNTTLASAWATVELNLSNIIANVPTLKLYFSRKSSAHREVKEFSRSHEDVERSAFKRRLRFSKNWRPVASIFPISNGATESNTAWSMSELAPGSRDLDKEETTQSGKREQTIERKDDEPRPIGIMVSQHIVQRSNIEGLLDGQERTISTQSIAFGGGRENKRMG